jgi:hypothetical protein
MGAAGSPPPLPKRRPLTFSEPAIDITQLLEAGQVEVIEPESNEGDPPPPSGDPILSRVTARPGEGDGSD